MRGMYARMLWAQFGKAAVLCLEVTSAKGMSGLKGVTVLSPQGSLCVCYGSTRVHLPVELRGQSRVSLWRHLLLSTGNRVCHWPGTLPHRLR